MNRGPTTPAVCVGLANHGEDAVLVGVHGGGVGLAMAGSSWSGWSTWLRRLRPFAGVWISGAGAREARW
jgi:hypothetical protein